MHHAPRCVGTKDRVRGLELGEGAFGTHLVVWACMDDHVYSAAGIKYVLQSIHAHTLHAAFRGRAEEKGIAEGKEREYR